MNAGAFAAIAPLILIAGTAVAVMLAAAFCRRHGVVAVLTLVGIAAAGLALAAAWRLAPRQVTPLLLVDRPALFYMGLILAAALVVCLLSWDYLGRCGADAGETAEPAALPPAAPRPRHEEYYILLLTATAGALTLVASAHFASLFLGLELISVSLFALVAYPRRNPLSLEAGVKYLILAGASSAFLLMGMGLVYAVTGTLEFGRLPGAYLASRESQVLALAGVSLILVGIGFKLSLAPFHLWAPDVYQGAPAPVTAFVATVSKGSVFALLLRYTQQLEVQPRDSLFVILTVLAIASMFVGNWLALFQRNLKRLLAYSSIAHMGYLLVALLAGGAWAPQAVAMYLTAYFITTLGAFGVVSVLSTREREADGLDDYRGLAWRRPWLAGVLAAMLLSLAGMPLTAGFIGKFYVLAAGVRSNLWLLVAVLAVNSAIGLFYYLRVLVTMFGPLTAAAGAPASVAAGAPPRGFIGCATLGALTLALVWLGVYPATLIRLVQAMFGTN